MWLQGSASRLSPSESCVNTHAPGADRTPHKQIETISAASPVKHSQRICHPGVVLGPCFGPERVLPHRTLFPQSSLPLRAPGQAAGQRWAERPHSSASGAPAHPAAVPVQGRGFLLLWRPLPDRVCRGRGSRCSHQGWTPDRSWQVPSGGQGLRAARVPGVTAEPPARSLARSVTRIRTEALGGAAAGGRGRRPPSPAAPPSRLAFRAGTVSRGVLSRLPVPGEGREGGLLRADKKPCGPRPVCPERGWPEWRAGRGRVLAAPGKQERRRANDKPSTGI